MPTKPLVRCPSCKQLVAGRCEVCRGTSTQRGYGAKHRRERDRLRPSVEAGYHNCWRCQLPIQPGQAWDLGHDDDDRRITRGPEHAECNRATAHRN